jgi:hypothetical protein
MHIIPYIFLLTYIFKSFYIWIYAYGKKRKCIDKHVQTNRYKDFSEGFVYTVPPEIELLRISGFAVLGWFTNLAWIAALDGYSFYYYYYYRHHHLVVILIMTIHTWNDFLWGYIYINIYKYIYKYSYLHTCICMFSDSFWGWSTAACLAFPTGLIALSRDPKQTREEFEFDVSYICVCIYKYVFTCVFSCIYVSINMYSPLYRPWTNIRRISINIRRLASLCTW